MNTRRYSRSMREAFPFGPEYGAAIERPRPYPRTLWITIALGFVYVIALGVWEAL